MWAAIRIYPEYNKRVLKPFSSSVLSRHERNPAGGAIAAGAGGTQLQNANGVILQLSGARVGAELSAAVGGVTITMR